MPSSFHAPSFASQHATPDEITGEEIRGLCAARGRNLASALAPLVEEEVRLRYAIADISDANAYHGVDFVWALELAHNDR